MQDDGFEEFSRKVCQDRLAALIEGNHQDVPEIQELLPSLSEEDEARLLGVQGHNSDTLRELQQIGPTRGRWPPHSDGNLSISVLD